jgi:ketosteroid isomerase-like protein
MDKPGLQRWLDAYVVAWRTYEPDKIRALFTDDAIYRFRPLDERPLKGRDAIVANWLESPDAPDSWTAEYRALAVDGDIAIAEGETHYPGDPKAGRAERRYANLWVMRFAPDGRCRDFTEWFMEPRKSS